MGSNALNVRAILADRDDKSEADQDDDALSVESLGAFDDEDMYLTNDVERQDKSDIWHDLNKDCLQGWHERAREKHAKEREKEASSMGETGSETSSKRRRRAPGAIAGMTTAESAALALQRRGVKPSRINLEELDKLFMD